MRRKTRLSKKLVQTGLFFFWGARGGVVVVWFCERQAQVGYGLRRGPGMGPMVKLTKKNYSFTPNNQNFQKYNFIPMVSLTIDTMVKLTVGGGECKKKCPAAINTSKTLSFSRNILTAFLVSHFQSQISKSPISSI